MAERIRVVLSIVISAVLLGVVVAWCFNRWMPVETFDWAMWITMLFIGVVAIYRIAVLAKALGKKSDE